ncbi:MAG: hypothetical protein ACM3SY_10815 [Candidatus Omnitrophota bacterium]
MDVKNYRVESLLEKAKVGFQIARDREDIRLSLAHLGYESTRLEELVGVYNQTNDKYLFQKEVYAQSATTTAHRNEKLKEEQTRYMDFRTLAFKAFIDPADKKYHELLGISMGMSKSMQGFITQARHFYQNALKRKEIMDKLSYFAITPEKLQAGLTGLEELEKLNNLQIANAGDAQRATRERDDSYKKLVVAYSTFVAATKIGLRQTPQLREVLGITERSVPIRKRKASNEETPDENPVDPPVNASKKRKKLSSAVPQPHVELNPAMPPSVPEMSNR